MKRLKRRIMTATESLAPVEMAAPYTGLIRVSSRSFAPELYVPWTWRRTLRFLWTKYVRLLVLGSARYGKRALDMGLSAVLLVALLPLFLVVAALIKLTDGGPVLFWQT